MRIPSGSDDPSHFIHQANPDVIGALLVAVVIFAILGVYNIWKEGKQ